MQNKFSIETARQLYESAWKWIDAYLLDWSTVVQAGAILLAFAIAYIVTLILKKRLPLGRLRDATGPVARSLAVLSDLTTPICWLIILWLGTLVSSQTDYPDWMVSTAVSLLTAWVAIRVASTFIRNAALARLIATTAWVVAALNIVDLLEPTLKLLDLAAVHVGGLRISAYGVIKGVLVLAVLLWLAGAVSHTLERRINTVRDLSPSIQVLFAKLLKILLVTVAVVAALSSMGIDLTAFALLSGAVGVGIGFGLQKVVGNLISGIILLIDKSVKPGDVIVVGNEYGRIQTLSARYASVITRDGIEHLIPNEDLITQRVENWSFSNDLIRLRAPVGIAYNSDLRLAMGLCIEAARAANRVLHDPPPICLLRGFGDSSVNLEVRFWINDPMNGRANVTSEVLIGVWDRFHEHGIQIPFPQRDLHIKTPEKFTIVSQAGPAE